MKLTQPSLSSPSVPAVSALALNASAGQGLVRSGLVAEYRFNEGSGQVLHDYSGNNNHGVLGSTTGADTNDPTWTGQGASFTTDDYITCSSQLSDSIINAHTIMAVCKNFATGSTNDICGAGYNYGNKHGISFRAQYDATNKAKVIICNGSAISDISTDAVIPADTYLAMTETYNGSTSRLYLNTTPQQGTSNSVSSPITYEASHNFRIGESGGGCMDGTISFIAIYNRALTQAEISQNYAYLKSYLLRERGISI